MQEEEPQRGLAHFLEHMCFNGTTHFPGNKLKTYLESIGVKFGENLNAYTSFDETVYNINNVKTTSVGSLDSCLLILHDWSHDLLLEGAEIDKERGVINEEWRMRRSAMQRMYEGALPDIYPGSKYAERMPIGTMDVVMNFPHDVLRAYYKKWYRPDLQAIIVVGDVDVDRTENKIKEMFADIQAPAADAAERVYFPVPDNAEPLVSIQKDKEQTTNVCILFMKHEAFPRELRNTMAYYAQDYITMILASGESEGMVGNLLAPWHSRTMRKKKPLPPSTAKCYAPHVSDSLRPSTTASNKNISLISRIDMRRRTRCRTRAMSTSVCVISSTEMPCRVSTWSIR